ncbi:hypothetical protein BOTBODRAFT_252598 [Botryobasidium botryosum FD-172 SS1]|uniref:DUF6533 domain-containing protein n=1 Tax=Botryobasidium botryosum (strain FD-172 SS1) TaxID=930990 RepID=A0A067MPC4_BOTB1|nr:hypothetical protein BOTBODRAFT_252598 [Botryobasidium botryosum FD-172 SS1]
MVATSGDDLLYYLFPTVCTLLCYDHAITFGEEVRLVWNAPWNLAKFLYLFLRYFTEIALLIDGSYRLHGHMTTSGAYPLVIRQMSGDGILHHCRLLTGLYTTAFTLSCLAGDLLLFIRVYAIWGRQLKVLVSMGVLFVVNYVMYACAPGVLSANMNERALFWGACSDLRIITPVYVSWAFSLLYEAVAFAMTLVRSIQIARNQGIRGTIFYVVFRDGLSYFVVLTILRACAFISAADSRLSVTSISVLARILSVVLTARMFLNLRGVRTHQDWAVQTNIRERVLLRDEECEIIRGESCEYTREGSGSIPLSSTLASVGASSG